MSRLCARISVAGCVFLPVILLFFSLGALAVNVPYWDDYGAIVRYMGWPFGDRMQHLFDFHNEHRIVTVRLFLEAMVALTGKVNFKTCMIFGTAQLLVVLACFAWFHLRHFGWRIGWTLLAAASWHLFSMLNFDNAFWALTALENFGVALCFSFCRSSAPCSQLSRVRKAWPSSGRCARCRSFRRIWGPDLRPGGRPFAVCCRMCAGRLPCAVASRWPCPRH